MSIHFYRIRVIGVLFLFLTLLSLPPQLIDRAWANSPYDGSFFAVVNESERDDVVRIGVLANRGREVCLQEWGPTADYLSSRLSPLRFEILPLDFDEIYPAIQDRKVTFIAANPSYYAFLEHYGYAHRIVTLQVPGEPEPQPLFGGVLFTRADRQDIETLTDLRGKRLSAVDSQSLGGWLAAKRELLQAGIRPYRDLSDIQFAGTHDAVVHSVLSGGVDAGTVRSSQLERMAQEGLLSLDQIQVIHSQEIPGYPYLLSTRLYPEWPFAALAGINPSLSKQVSVALLMMDEGADAARAIRGAGWAIPQDYANVHELLRELRLPPYDEIETITFAMALRHYWPWLAGGAALFLAMWGFAVYVSALNQRMRGMSNQLARNEKRLEATLRSIGDGVITCDNLGAVVSLNSAAERLTGWTDEEAHGRFIDEVFYIINAETRARSDNPVARVLREGVVLGLANHTALIARDGVERQIADSCAPIFLADGESIGAVLVFRDVTEEYKIQKRIQDDEKFLRATINAFSNAFAVVNVNDYTIEMANQVYGGDFVVGKTCHAVSHHQDTPCSNIEHPCPIDALRLTRQPVVVEHIHQDKHGHPQYIELHAHPIFDEDGRLVRMIEHILDITERKRIEDELRESEERTRAITESAQDAILVMNPEGNISYWNTAAERIFGYTREEAIGRDLHRLIAPKRYHAQFRKVFIRFRETGQGDVVGKTRILEALRKDGQEISVELSLSALRLSKGWYAVGILRDITERIETEAALLETNRRLEEATLHSNKMAAQAEKANQAKSEFLANMSHEIRTPMNGVIGMTGLLLDTDLSDEQRHYAEIVRTSGESLLSLVNDILDFSKIEAGKLDLEELDFNLQSLMEDFASTLALRAHNKGIEFICACDPATPAQLRGDPGRLRQILTNLVGNAIKFTHSGEVAVLASLEEETEAEVVLRFAIRDTGIGIPQEKMEHLFDKFVQVDASNTRQYGGTGLGLAISKQLAELMGGEIGVTSKIGKGSEFWFTVRLERKPGWKPTESPPPADLSGVRALIVDDNAANREIVNTYLSSWGMRPSEVQDAALALKALYDAIDENDPFRVAVIDMQMPGMDGESLGRAIKADERISDVRMVMLTSLGMRGDAKRFEEIGFSAYLTKPVRRKELKNILSLSLANTGDLATMSHPIATRHSARDARPVSLGRSARILLAEDNITNQQVALGILKKLGMRVDAAANGVETVKALEIIPYDLVLMDVQMPEMDGLEATRLIRDPSSMVLNHEIPIIAMTAHAMQGDRAKCLDAGMNDYISKPVTPGILAETLKRWLPIDMNEDDNWVNRDDRIEEYPIWDREGMLARLMNDEDLANTVIKIFVDDIPRQMKALQNSLDKGDLLDTLRHAHTIKGSSANVGAERLRETALALENAAKTEDVRFAVERLSDMKLQFERFKDAIASVYRV